MYYTRRPTVGTIKINKGVEIRLLFIINLISERALWGDFGKISLRGWSG